jgi:hypothetical protein
VFRRFGVKVLATTLFASLMLAGSAAPATADGSLVVVPIFERFNDINPCSGLVHTVTVVGTLLIRTHDDHVVIHGDRSVTTSSGFVGGGTFKLVENGQIQNVKLSDRLVHPSGAAIDAGFHLVLDLSSGTAKHFVGGVTCASK